ncbi:peptide/nickel transport system permease protein [Nonomuraea solani]|uniref:Peptide/nickel transport system permease protein n=1 Tax=Nonomuraea solani TaxID=1144553 RepID=A0A1H6EYK5_9ACTN|nr:ABC transporter permease [Nonomuraea solani]SEH02171.1 peptide/nickel transport system permease protein [Nonomuraea solani]
MIRFLIRRLPVIALVLAASSLIAFLLPRLMPGDPAAAVAGPEATPEQIAQIRHELGLDQPIAEQYVQWIKGLFTGDLGQSLQFRRPVAELVGTRLESTVELALAALIFMVIIGVGIGLVAGTVRAAWLRTAIDSVNTLLLAAPGFLVGLLMVLLFGIVFRVLPTSGEIPLSENAELGVQYLILPALALSLASASGIARLVQTSMRAVRQQDFVDLAVAKGVPSGRIATHHVLRNSLGPALVAIGIRFGDLLAGAVVIEAIFARNGLGQLAVSSAQTADYPVVQVLIVGAVLIAVAAQLLTEIGLARLDPRVRLE